MKNKKKRVICKFRIRYAFIGGKIWWPVNLSYTGKNYYYYPTTENVIKILYFCNNHNLKLKTKNYY